MQIPNITSSLGILLLLIGIILIIAALLSMSVESKGENQIRRESKGVVLLGPIPIVWGYGRRGWIVAAIIALSLFILALVFL